MMDASLRRSVLCLVGSVLAVVALLAWPCHAQTKTTSALVYFHPSTPVMGYPLDVIVSTEEHHKDKHCTLTLFPEQVFPLDPEHHDLSWEETNLFSVRVLVKPKFVGPLNVTVQCEDGTEQAMHTSVEVVSDVDMTAVWSYSPSPADKDKQLLANLTLTNQGGHAAVNVKCSVALKNPTTNSLSKLICGGKDSGNSMSCQLGLMNPRTPVLLQLTFDSIKEDENVTVKCTSHNAPDASLSFEVMLKGDANIQVTLARPEGKVSAGLNTTVDTTIKNTGRAKADAVVCALTIDKPESTVLVGLTDSRDKCALVHSDTNVTTGARCEFGDLESQASTTVSVVLHVDAAAKADDFILAWSCNAAGLAEVQKNMTISAQVEANFTLVLPTNSSIAAGTQALLFRMRNPGPSFISDGSCNFTLPKGVRSDVWSPSKFFKCAKDEGKRPGGNTMLNCDIETLPPADTEFNLSLKLDDITLEDFVIEAECEMKNPPVKFKEDFVAFVGVVPSPSPAPSPGPAPDNSMMVVVTVIVAVGLLIVIAIWWRRRQESSGWDAVGPTARSPSLNRFTDMELSVRSDD